MFKKITIEDWSKQWAVRDGTNDEGIIQHVFRDNIYGLPEDMKGKVVIDVGAHIGSFTVLAATSGATVYSFEPEFQNILLLRENVKEHEVFSNTHIFMFGIGISSVKDFYIGDIFNSGSNTTFSDLLVTKTIRKIKLVPLSEMFRQLNISHCDFLKIDCEGGEKDILADFFKHDLVNKVDMIGIEFHYPELMDEQLKMLSKHYTLKKRDEFEYLCIKK